MNLKKILSKTVEFIFVVGFVIAFKSIFGGENTLIGVTTITAMLLFLGKDLTLEPIKNTLGLIFLNVLLGIFAYVSNTNMYIGIIVNFIAIFFVTFRFSYNLKLSSYIPFTLQYLFMLATPVGVERLPLRLSSLFFGAIVIMGVQLIVNRDRIGKYGDKMIISICDLLLEKIRCVNNESDYDNIDKNIRSLIYSFKKVIYEKREKNYYLTEEEKVKLNIVMAINQVSELISKNKNEDFFKYISEDIIVSIDNIRICLANKSNLQNLEGLFDDVLLKYKYKNVENNVVYKLLNNLNFIKKSLVELQLLEGKYNKIKRDEKIPTYFNQFNIYIRELKKDSLRFSFAFRYALGVSIGAFITSFFSIEEGRWIYFTIASLSQPQYELVKQKSGYRIFGTIIGTIIITILFGIITDDTLRSLVIVAAGYIGGYFTEYKYKMICVTVSAIGSVALISGAFVLSIERLLYVLLGMAIAILLARFVFPYRSVDANNDLIKMYKGCLSEMINELYKLLMGSKDDNGIKNLILSASLIEDKLITNNSTKNNDGMDLMINNGRTLALNIFELYEWIKENRITMDSSDEIKHIYNMCNTGVEINEEECVTLINNLKDIKDKITVSSILTINSEFLKIKRI